MELIGGLVIMFVFQKILNKGFNFLWNKGKELFRKKGEQIMDISLIYADFMSVISPILVLSGMLALTISFIVMLVNMVIGAATGKGFNIGLR